jgi:nicotinate-nucleotide--dimethylbenzimidazole phosphoribosyltransferase
MTWPAEPIEEKATESITESISETIAAIRPPDEAAMRAARAHQDRLTKPPGALGVLEDVSVRLAGLAGTSPPPLPQPAAVAIFAADHGVHAQGVSPWPQEVTAQMVANFVAGGAVVNALAGQVGAGVTVVDVGVATDIPTDVPSGVPTGIPVDVPVDVPRAGRPLLSRKVAYGTADLTLGPAMTLEQAGRAVDVGIEVASDLVAAGNRCLITGDMGIANTTPSAALIAAVTSLPPEAVTGRGTGIDDATHTHKVEVVRAGLARHATAVKELRDLLTDSPSGRPGGENPGADGRQAIVLRALAALGGLEHAALAGFILGGAARRVPVVLDGVIAGAAALVAMALAPQAIAACFAGHRSSEPGHAATVVHLGLRPLIDLELRLGEGTGALLALPLVQCSARILHDVATFGSAGVTEKQRPGATEGSA